MRHRGALRPADVGLSEGARRRTSGLRREEVASLASMSTDYYARLEQRRGPQPSTQMLASLARALRLTLDERDYLFRVAGHSAPARASDSGHVAPALLRVLDRLADTPAMILSALDEVLVQNDAARALFGDASGLTGFARSGIHRWFVDPDRERALYPLEDHERHGRSRVAALRAAYGTMGAESRAGELVRELSRRSEEFAAMWEAHEVSTRFEDRKTFVHPAVGRIEVDCQALLTEDQTQALLVITADPRSADAEKLALLTVLGTQDLAPSES